MQMVLMTHVSVASLIDEQSIGVFDSESRRMLQETNAIPDGPVEETEKEGDGKDLLSINTVASACVAGVVLFSVSVGSMLWATSVGSYQPPPDQEAHTSTSYSTGTGAGAGGANGYSPNLSSQGGGAGM